MDLPKPEVQRCFSERSFEPPLPAMELRWDTNAVGVAERTWHLPDQLLISGLPPDRFGVAIHRCEENKYQVRVMWNRLCLSWEGLTRREIMTSALASILNALGTDPWYLLNQPIEDEAVARAA